MLVSGVLLIKTPMTTILWPPNFKTPSDKTEHLNHHGDLLVPPTAEDEVD
jgi:hypothetical protein